MVDYNAPIYLQLREVVRTKIEEGEYLPGMAIPSENELAEFYGINRLTVRNAIDALVGEGMLKRVQGKGVYVVGNKIERDLETLGGFTQTMHDKHARPTKKILVKAQREAGVKYAHIFNIKQEDMLYYIKRLDYADGEPISMEEIMLPHSVVPKLEEIDLTVFSLYEVYDFYGINLKRAWQTLDLAELEPSDARMLNVDPGRAVLLFSSTSYDENDQVVEYARSYTRGDKCNYSVHFYK
ncbi:GntR family transcriptional regulator [Caproiciproducens sp.]|uniref:GntR family transcriptional regulator n=1 Tax=Caproiciproducens sp. TaxID=1954376 RepID=UPI00289E18ED|nr:GntR family transcriptional regulator [Caproiciproducens sp.]